MRITEEQLRRERNLVAHKQEGTSDKVYMACIRWDVNRREWMALGKWGRRGGKMSSQVKGSGTIEHCKKLQHDLFQSKLSEGYVDIDSAGYAGSLGRGDYQVAVNMETGSLGVGEKSEGYVDMVDEFKKMSRKMAAKEDDEVDEPKGTVAVCVDNVGVEDKFDAGVSYVWEENGNKGMIWVYDRTGRKQECFKTRFRMVKED